MRPHGIFAEITTPFNYKGDIYRTKVQHNVEKWNQVALAGYVVCGHAGEAAALSIEERTLVWELVAKYASPDKLLLASMMAVDSQSILPLMERVSGLGYKAVVLDRAQAARTLEGTGIPILLVSDEHAPDQISSHPRVAGILETAKRPQVGQNVLVSDATTLWDSLRRGASGAVLAFASAAPYATIAIWEAYQTREEQAGMDWQARIASAAQLVGAQYGTPGLKYAMDLNGYYGGRTRTPGPALSSYAKNEIENAFRSLKG